MTAKCSKQRSEGTHRIPLAGRAGKAAPNSAHS